MARSAHRSAQRDDYDVEARRPSIPGIIALALVATALALSIVASLGALFAHLEGG